MRDVFNILFDKNKRFLWLAYHGFYNKWPDRKYISRKFEATMGYPLNLDNPQTLNEKLQWLKLYDRKLIYTTMVDKYAVKEYVASIIGEEYIIPTLGVWSSFDEIDFNSLPNSFVLKCTHDSGGLFICTNKKIMDYKMVRLKIQNSLNRNYFWNSREWPYKDVKPRIIAEKYLGDNMIDYKFYCFNGEPKYLYVSKGLTNHKTATMSFFDLDWNNAGFGRSDYKPYVGIPEKPSKFNEMISIASRLSKNIPFLRVDLYQVSEQVLFSELTFSPCGGFMPFAPKEYDKLLGDLLILPNKDI